MNEPSSNNCFYYAHNTTEGDNVYNFDLRTHNPLEPLFNDTNHISNGVKGL